MITILDLAVFRGIKADENDSISAQAFHDVGLPFMGGCQRCQATIAAYNAYPTKNGYLSCADCCGEDEGYETAEEADNDIKEMNEENEVHYSEDSSYDSPDEYDVEAYEEELAYYRNENDD